MLTSTRVRKADMSDPIDLPEIPVPATESEIENLRVEIDQIDGELVRLIKRRTAISHAIGTARIGLGGPRVVHSREMRIFDRFRDLGQPGVDLAMMLLDLGRGKLGRARGH